MSSDLKKKIKKICRFCIHYDWPQERKPDDGTCWIDGMRTKGEDTCHKWKEFK